MYNIFFVLNKDFSYHFKNLFIFGNQLKIIVVEEILKHKEKKEFFNTIFKICLSLLTILKSIKEAKSVLVTTNN
jgi:hypothetical protein